jgi:hypothetical protein
MTFDPRTIATPVYEALSGLRTQYNTIPKIHATIA